MMTRRKNYGDGDTRKMTGQQNKFARHICEHVLARWFQWKPIVCDSDLHFSYDYAHFPCDKKCFLSESFFFYGVVIAVILSSWASGKKPLFGRLNREKKYFCCAMVKSLLEGLIHERIFRDNEGIPNLHEIGIVAIYHHNNGCLPSHKFWRVYFISRLFQW